MIYASLSKLSKKLKNDIEILVDQVVFKLWIKTVKILFWSIHCNSRTAWPTKMLMLFLEFLGQFTIRCMYHFSKICWKFWDGAQNMLISS